MITWLHNANNTNEGKCNMTVIMKHITKGGHDEMIYENGTSKVLFDFGKDKGNSGWSFEVYQGEDYVCGFNVLGNRISGPYNNVGERRVAVSGFYDIDDRDGRYCYMEEGHGPALFVAEGRPFNRITFCAKNGSRAIDMFCDENGCISSVARSRYADLKEDTLVIVENEDNPKLNKVMRLGWHYDGDYRINDETQNGGLLKKLQNTPKKSRNSNTNHGTTR